MCTLGTLQGGQNVSFNAVEFLNDLVNENTTGLEHIASAYDLPMEWRVEYEERAAILEYDGGLSRDEADRRAFVEIKQRLEKN